MLRATKYLSLYFFLAIAFAYVGQANAVPTYGHGAILDAAPNADLINPRLRYELGPFQAIGFGDTASEAQADAYGEAWDIIASIAAILPEGHVIVEFVVENEGMLGDSYVLDFHIVVEYDA